MMIPVRRLCRKRSSRSNPAVTFFIIRFKQIPLSYILTLHQTCLLYTSTKEEVEPTLLEAISLNVPVVIDCQIGTDDKVFPMVPAGKPIEEAFDEIDLRLSLIHI